MALDAVAIPPQITLSELLRRLADPDTPPEDIRPYLVRVPSATGRIEPEFQPNPALATGIGHGLEGGFMLSGLNEKPNLPRIVSEGDSWFQYPMLLDAAGDTLAQMIAQNELPSMVQRERATGYESVRWATVTIDNYRYIRFNLRDAQQVGVPDAPPGGGIGYGFVSAEEATDEPPVFDDRRFSTRPEDTINLPLGDVDEWILTSNAPVGHPFHIHINPFEVMAVNRTITRDGVVVVLRSHYERYIGRFVLHCHILSHEDAGVMRIVEIHDPGRLSETGVLESAHAGHN